METGPHYNSRLPPPPQYTTPYLPLAFPHLLSLAVDVTMSSHVSTSGQGRRSQQKKMGGVILDHLTNSHHPQLETLHKIADPVI